MENLQFAVENILVRLSDIDPNITSTDSNSLTYKHPPVSPPAPHSVY